MARFALSLLIVFLTSAAYGAPTLTLTTARGEALELEALKHRGWFALRFLTATEGEGVAKELAALREEAAALAPVGVRTVAISPLPVDVLRPHAQGVAFPVCTDLDGVAARRFGACWDADPKQLRSLTVVLDPQLRVALRATSASDLAQRVLAIQDALPAVDLRPAFAHFGLKVRRQGRRPTCSVFTTVGALELSSAIQRGKGEALSVEYLNWATNDVINNHTKNRGQFFHHLWRGFQRHGVSADAEFPYRRTWDPKHTPPAELRAKAKARRAGLTRRWIKKLKTKNGATPTEQRAIKRALARGYAVCAGSSHSVLVVGYDDAQQRYVIHDSGSGRVGHMSYARAAKKLDDVYFVETQPAPWWRSADS